MSKVASDRNLPALVLIVFSTAMFARPVVGAASAAPFPDLSGQWGRDTAFFEPPPSGPGPVVSRFRKPDGTINAAGAWAGDYTNPILKPEAAEAVRKRGEMATNGTVAPDMHNRCWPEPPPFVMALQLGVQILQQKDKITLLYLLGNTLRHVPLNARHPNNVAPSWQGDSIGWYEGDTLVIDTVGIKVAPLSTVDPFGTPHTKALHVVEIYRLIDGKAAAEALSAHGIIARPFNPYGRGDVDPDTAKKGLQVEFTVEDEGVFTTPWSARVTYRPVIGDWPEAVCAENPFFLGTDARVPTADRPDF